MRNILEGGELDPADDDRRRSWIYYI